METKPLLYGLIGFFLGGLIVSLAATHFDTNKTIDNSMAATMQASIEDLRRKTGDDFDKTFLSEMIMRHQGAIDMAKLAEKNAKHGKVKQLSKDIVSTQESEISQMKRWQADWGYAASDQIDHRSH